MERQGAIAGKCSLSGEPGVPIAERRPPEGMPAQIAAFLAGLDIRECRTGQLASRQVRLGDGPAENGGVDEVRPAAGDAVDIAEAGGVGTGDEVEGRTGFEAHYGIGLPAAEAGCGSRT